MNNNSKLDTFGIVITSFLMEEKDKRFCFFKGTFLIANLGINITLRMLFFTLTNIKINFVN